MNSWERKFLNDLPSFILRNGGMTIRQRYFFEKLYKNLGSSHPLILKINNIPKSRNIFEGKPYKPNIRRLPFKETVIFGGLARLAYYFAERLVL